MHLQSLFLAVTMCHMAIAAAPRDVYYQGLLTPLNITPTFDKGYLFVHDAYKIDVFGPGGSHLNDVAAVVAKAKVVNIINAAADADGTTAGAVEYSFDGSTRTEHGGIAVFDSSGKQERFFDTGLYFPTQVAFGPDHSIWTLGWPGIARRWSEDFCILRNYSRDGRELGAFLPRSSLPGEIDPIGPMVGMWELRVIRDRIGAVIYESSVCCPEQSTRPPMLWVETDFKGKELGRWEVGLYPAPAAFTQSGGLYTRSDRSVSVFNRTTRTWCKVAMPADGILLGADGDSLVFLNGTDTLRWIPAGQ